MGDNFTTHGSNSPITVAKGHSTATTTITTERHDSVITLQGELSSLADDLRGKDFNEDAEYVENIVKTFEEAQELIDTVPEVEMKETLTKKGIIKKIADFRDELTDENSELYKKTAQLRNGAKKLQSVLKVYNEFAKMIPVLPQVPDALLKAGK